MERPSVQVEAQCGVVLYLHRRAVPRVVVRQYILRMAVVRQVVLAAIIRSIRGQPSPLRHQPSQSLSHFRQRNVLPLHLTMRPCSRLDVSEQDSAPRSLNRSVRTCKPCPQGLRRNSYLRTDKTGQSEKGRKTEKYTSRAAKVYFPRPASILPENEGCGTPNSRRWLIRPRQARQQRLKQEGH